MLKWYLLDNWNNLLKSQHNWKMSLHGWLLIIWKLILGKTELLVIPSEYILLSFLDNSLISPLVNLGVNISNQLSFSFLQVNFSFKISEGFVHFYPFRPLRCSLILSLVISRLDYWTSSLSSHAWAPFLLWNWSTMQVYDLFSALLSSPITPTATVPSLVSCSWQHQI